MLEEQNESDHDSWETRYCLLLWLSIIVIIPFDMRKLDGTMHIESKTTLQRFLKQIKLYFYIFYCQLFIHYRLVDIVMKYLSSGDACRDMATVLATRLFTRSDVKESHLPIFLDWVKLVSILKFS